MGFLAPLAAFVAKVGTAAAGLVGVTGLGAAATYAIGGALLVGGTILATKAFRLFDIEMPKADTDGARTYTTKGTIEPVKIVYGQALVSGPIVYVGVAGTENQDLYHAIALTAHECESINSLFFDDIEITTAQRDGSGNVTAGIFAPVTDVSGSASTTIVQIETHDGTYGTGGQNVSRSALLGAAFNSDWTNNHLGKKIGYIVTKWSLPDSEKAAEVWDKYTPTNIKAIVKGVKNIYDPRDDTSVGANPTSATYQSWSDNPALCLAHYMTDTEFGVGIPVAKIDWQSVADAANDCDVTVDIPGGTEKTFTCNGVAFGTDSHKRNITKLLSSMNGNVMYANGKYYIQAGAFDAATESLNENDLRGPVSIKTSVERSSRFNTIKPIYASPSDNYKMMELPPVTVGNLATSRDNGEVLEKQVQFPFTNGSYMAQRLAHQQVNRSSDQRVLTFPANLKGMRIKVGDRVQVTLSEFGYTNKVFQCIGWQFGEGDAGGVDLTLIEDTASRYTAPASGFYSQKTNDGTINSGFPGVSAPQSLTATGAEKRITVAWTNPVPASSFSRIYVYGGNSNVFANHDKVWQVNTETITEELASGTTRYYWVRAVKYGDGATSGNSALVGPANATASTITADSVEWADVDNRAIGIGQSGDALTLTGVDTDNSTATGQGISESGINQGVSLTQTSGGVTFNQGGSIKTTGKDNELDTTAGFFLGYNSTLSTPAYTFAVGDATNSMIWTGEKLKVKGSAEVDSLIVNNNFQLLGENFVAGAVRDGSITGDMLDQSAINRILGSVATATGSTNGDYKSGSGSFTSSGGNIVLGSSGNLFDHGNLPVELEANFSTSWFSTTNYNSGSTTSGGTIRLDFEVSTDGSSYTSVHNNPSITIAKYDLSSYYGTPYFAYYIYHDETYTVTTNATGTGADLQNGVDVYFRCSISSVGSPVTGQTVAFTFQANEGVKPADTVTGSLTVTGDLTVQGTTTTVNSATLDVADRNITVNYATGDSSSTADGAGITIQDAVDANTDATILWDQTNSEFDFSHDINLNTKKIRASMLHAGTPATYFVKAEGSPGDAISVSGNITATGSLNGTTISAGGNTIVDLSQNLQNIGNLTMSGTLTSSGTATASFGGGATFAGDTSVYTGAGTGSFNVGRGSTQRFNLYVTDGLGYIRYYQDETGTTNHSVNFEIQSSSSGTNQFYFNKGVNVTGGTTASSFTTNTTRVVSVSNGAITMKGDSGGWAFGLHAIGNADTNHGGFGFLGGADDLTYYYIGAAYNDANVFKFYKSGNLSIAGNATVASTLTGQKLVSTDGILELDDNGTHNGIINVPASLRINIDSDNNNTSESFQVGSNVTNISGSNILFKVEESGLATFYGDVSIPVGNKLYFGGSNHTYISEDIDDRLRVFVGGAEFMRFSEGTADSLGIYVDTTLTHDVTIEGKLVVDNSEYGGFELTSDSSSGSYAHIKSTNTSGPYAFLRLTPYHSGGSSNGYLIKNITGGTSNSVSSGSLYLYNDSGAIDFVPNGTAAYRTTIATDGVLTARSNSDAPLNVISTDAFSGIKLGDPDGDDYIYYRGATNHFYTHSGSFSVGGSTISSGYEFQVNGDANITGGINAGTIEARSDSPYVYATSTGAANDAVIAARWTAGTAMEMRYHPNTAIGYLQNTYDKNSGTVFGDIHIRQKTSGSMVTRMLFDNDEANLQINTPVEITGNGRYVGGWGYGTLVLQDTSGYPGIYFREGNINWLQRKSGANDDMEFVYSSNASAPGTGSFSERFKIHSTGGISVNNGLIQLDDSQPIKWGAENILSHNGTTTYLGDNSSASALNITNKNVGIEGDLTIGQASNKGVLNFLTYDDQAHYWAVYTWNDDTFRMNFDGSGGDEFVLDSSGNVTFSGYVTADAYRTANGFVDVSVQNSVQAIGEQKSAFMFSNTSYDNVFSVLPWSSGHLYLTFGGYYDGSNWKVRSTASTPHLSLLVSGHDGFHWYSTTSFSNGNQATWNQASDVPLWNQSGQWNGDINTTYDIQTGSIVASGTSTFTKVVANSGGVQVQGGGTYSDTGNQLYLHADASGYCRIAGYDISFNTGANNSRTQSLRIEPDGDVVFSQEAIFGHARLSHSTDHAWRGLTIQNTGDTNECTVDGKSSDGTQQFVVYGGAQSQGFLHPTSYNWRFKVPTSGNLQRDGNYDLFDAGNYPTGLSFTGDTTGSGTLSASTGTKAIGLTTQKLTYLGTYIWNASDNPHETSGTTGQAWHQGITSAFVQSANGYPSYGSVMRIKTYPNDGGAGELYFPYNTSYGGNHLKYRLGRYNNAGMTSFYDVIDSSGFHQNKSGAFGASVFYDNSTTSYYLDLASTGDSLRVPGNIVAYYSDERLKDIEGRIPNALDAVRTLEGFYYTPNEKAQRLGYKKKREVGLSAQAVQAVLPEVVTEAPVDANYLTVDYARLVPLLVESIKELSDQVKDLQKQIEDKEK